MTLCFVVQFVNVLEALVQANRLFTSFVRKSKRTFHVRLDVVDFGLLLFSFCLFSYFISVSDKLIAARELSQYLSEKRWDDAIGSQHEHPQAGKCILHRTPVQS